MSLTRDDVTKLLIICSLSIVKPTEGYTIEIGEVTEDLVISKPRDISETGKGEGAGRIYFESDNSYEPE